MYALREFTCPGCRKPTKRRAPAGAVVRCHPCAIEHAAEVARQMAAKEGPYWQKWLFAYSTKIRRMARELPPLEAKRSA